MIIIQKPAGSIVAGDILVYDQFSEGERETAEVLFAYTYEADTFIAYRNAPDTRLKTYVYPSDAPLNCVDIAALAGAETEEMESRESWIEAIRKEPQS